MRSKTTRGSLEPLPGLAGAASGLAGSGLAHRLTGGGASEGDPGDEIRERLDLMEERLQRLEDEVRALREGERAPPKIRRSQARRRTPKATCSAPGGNVLYNVLHYVGGENGLQAVEDLVGV